MLWNTLVIVDIICLFICYVLDMILNLERDEWEYPLTREWTSLNTNSDISNMSLILTVSVIISGICGI